MIVELSDGPPTDSPRGLEVELGGGGGDGGGGGGGDGGGGETKDVGEWLCCGEGGWGGEWLCGMWLCGMWLCVDGQSEEVRQYLPPPDAPQQ